MNITDITWGSGQYWILFPLVLAVWLFLLFGLYKRKKVYEHLSSKQWFTSNFKARSWFIYSLKTVLWFIAVLAIFVTLLRPQWGKVEQKIEQEGRDLLIAVDVSRSMLAQDVKPNRLEFTKQKIKDLLKMLPCERVGLLLFAGSPIVQCPLTNDYNAFQLFLDQLDAHTISYGTTALDQAINKALTVFEHMPDKKNKMLVIFTDGEDFSSNLADVKQKAIALGLHMFTVGIGTEQGAPIPILDEDDRPRGHERDKNGSVIISRLNEGILRTLAHDSGGVYISSTPDNTDMQQLVTIVTQFEKEKFEDKQVAAQQERYYYSSALALATLLIEWFL